ncbi:fumarate reductase cytochrome b subunit [Desulfobacula sp.]
MDSYIIESNKKKSRMPARLDFAQSGTGLILGLFMWVHMLLVGSIILGKGSFNFVAKTMELAFLSDTGHGYPLMVFLAVFVIFTLFILHACLGVRKFPISWKQHRILRDQMQMMNHTDTNLWYVQIITGFIMFFAGSVHLYIMLTHPGSIDPYVSADRMVSSNMWPLYLILLICVELHGTIGLYRLCMKWGWFAGKDARKSRQTLQKMKNRATIFFLTIGVLALLIFVVIGIKHRDNVGERYSKQGIAVEKVLADDGFLAEVNEPANAQSTDLKHQ